MNPWKKECSREGCAKMAESRGMCDTHYTYWRRHQVKMPVKQLAEDLVIDELPGTRHQLTERTGLAYETVCNVIKQLRLREWVHIEDRLPPMETNSNYEDVFAIGQGEDYKVPRALRLQNARRTRQAWYAVNKAKPPRRRDHLVGALFGMAA